MRRTNRQLRLVTDPSVQSTRLTDTCGNPSESYHWRQLAAIHREWQQEFWRPDVNGSELSFTEITSVESKVRRELYP